MAKWAAVLLAFFLVLGDIGAQESRRLRFRGDSDQRVERQLPSRIRTRSRVRRPPIVRPGDLDNNAENENAFTLSRNPSRLSDEQDQPRFIPSRGGSPSAALTRGNFKVQSTHVDISFYFLASMYLFVKS